MIDNVVSRLKRRHRRQTDSDRGSETYIFLVPAHTRWGLRSSFQNSAPVGAQRVTFGSDQNKSFCTWHLTPLSGALGVHFFNQILARNVKKWRVRSDLDFVTAIRWRWGTAPSCWPITFLSHSPRVWLNIFFIDSSSSFCSINQLREDISLIGMCDIPKRQDYRPSVFDQNFHNSGEK